MHDVARIRAIESRDRTAAADVLARCGLFGDGDLPGITALLEAAADGRAEAGATWLVDDGDSSVAGVAYVAPEPFTAGTWNLYLIAYAPEYQGAGRGAAMVRAVETAVARQGARVLIVETTGGDAFAPVRAFYLRCGFEQVARIPEFYAAGDDKIVFWKRVAPATP